jgi:hypothetical protein
MVKFPFDPFTNLMSTPRSSDATSCLPRLASLWSRTWARMWAHGRMRGIAALVAALALLTASVQLVMTPASHADPTGNAVAAGAQSVSGSVVAAAAAGPSGGEWETTGTGSVTPLDGATPHGSITQALAKPIVGMAATPDGGGYWLVGADGGVFSFGDAVFHGGTGGTRLNAPIVGMAATPDGGGYWLVGTDGGIFTYGDATFYGGEGGTHLNARIVGMASTPDGKGYWLVGADGGTFSFGDAVFHGGMGGTHLNAPVVGMAVTPSGTGYWLVGADGGVFSFGSATFYGSGVGQMVTGAIVDVIPSPDGAGYNLTSQTGTNYRFGDGPAYSPATGALMRGGGLVDLPGDCSDMQTLGYSWYYDWELNTSCPNVGVPFVPMQFGDWCAGASTCSAPPVSSTGSAYLLTFNEPDNPAQSNMTVARALQLWPYLEATGLQLGSPAVSDSSSGSAWLAQFMAGARQDGYRVDFIAVHWYGNCSDPQSLISYLAGMESYGLPLWLTEFSCLNDSAAVNTSFLQQVGPQLEALPYLQRIGWFSNRPYSGGYQNTGLLDASGALSTVGQAYTALPAG